MAGATTKKISTTCFIPQELVFRILTYLPVLSVLRCKSVCKTWLSIISNPQFIETHIIQSLTIQPSSLLYVVNKSIFVDTCDSSTLLCVLEFFNWPIEIVCSCNGLVCVADRAAQLVYLGNPVTRQFKKLPPPSEQEDCEEFLLGFGFDDISNDYKILRISKELEQEDEEDDDTMMYALQAELYSANDDSWKQIQIPETLEYFPISRVVCVNLKGSRVLYFEGSHELLSFDLHDEVFRVYPYPISYPTSLRQKNQRIKSFVLDFEGSVALIFNESTDDGSVPSLWTLNEVLGNWSWTKEFNLDHSFKEIQLTRLYMGDGQFFSRGVSGYIFYDYKKKHVKKILDHAPLLLWKLTDYTETLVSLEGFEQLK